MSLSRLGALSLQYLSRFLLLVCVVFLACGLVACGDSDSKETEESKQEQTEETSDSDEDASADSEEEEKSKKVSLGKMPSGLLADFPSDLAVSSLQNAYDPDRNMMFSPYNYARALTIAANAANGDTFDQIMGVLSYDDLNVADDAIQGYSQSIKKASQLSLASSVWVKDSYTLNEKVVDALTDFFEININSAPFDSDTVKQVNKWASDNTDGDITKVLKSFGDKAEFTFVDVGRFSANWDRGFDSLTRGTFHGNVDEKQVQFMNLDEASVYESPSFRAVGLEYEGGRFYFLGMLPTGDLSEFIQNMNSGTLNSAISSAVMLSSAEAKVSIPKFSADWSASLVDVAKAQGIEDAFDSEKADFSDLITAPIRGLSISNIIQKNYIDFDEVGVSLASSQAEETEDEDSTLSTSDSTSVDSENEDAAEDVSTIDASEEETVDGEAADASAEDVTESDSSSVDVDAAESGTDETSEEDSLVFDRPFLYVIYDSWAGLPVFMGTVVNL